MTKNGCTADRRWLLPWQGAILSLTVSAALVGCGGGPAVAPVSGKVTYKGNTVEGGSLIFSPVGEKNPGKPAQGDVKSDGSFTLQTHSPGDGALVGRHRVSYTPPQVKPSEVPNVDPPPPKYMGLAPKEAEVEVKVGDNTINIELVPKKK